MLVTLDYGVIAFYFLFMSALGWYFRRGNADSSDYFRASGAMPWWLAGASAFMGAFSAWTFTGAAGIAYDGGLVVLLIYWANGLGFAIGALWFGARFRQTRLITIIEIVRQRLGRLNEQIIVWLGIPLAVVRAAIWLYGLAIFLSPVFNMDVTTVIIVCGVVVVLVSALGGAHAVVTGDFMQTLLLMPITIIMAYLAIEKIGGVGPLIDSMPPEHFDLVASSLPGFGLLWLVALLFEKIIFYNNISNAVRFLCVSDGREAKRLAWFGAVLFFTGSFLWFIPAFAARGLGLDLAAQFPDISKPAETAYAAMALLTLPAGLLGLLVTGLIAATLSSMDAGLNLNAGIFVRGLYRPIFRPKASEKELVRVGQLSTAALGVIIVLLALKYSTWQDVGVFTLMFNVSAMLFAPGMVPLFWSLFTKKSPDWAIWTAQLIGFITSAVLTWVPHTEWIQSTGLVSAELADWIKVNEYSVIMIANTVICSLWFWGATLLAPIREGARVKEVAKIFEDMDRPLTTEEGANQPPGHATKATAQLCLIYGVFIGVIALLPNSLRGHLGLLFCAAFMAGVGFLLRFLYRRGVAKHLASVGSDGSAA